MTDDPQVTHPKARPQKLTARFGLAVAFANQLHRRQPRKGSSIPYMSHLLGVARLAMASKSGLLVSACDKLHNARSILGDYREVGEALWSRFTGGKEGTLWYYQALIGAYGKAEAPVAPPVALIDELGRTLAELERLVPGRKRAASAGSLR